jgi:phosphoribosylformylglycinamidine synthase
MIQFFKTPGGSVIATECDHTLTDDNLKALCWLFGEATVETNETLEGYFIGPRREMVTPWSTNAVEITQNMNIQGIRRIEEYFPVESEDADYDPMLQRLYRGLSQDIFTVDIQPAPIRFIDDLDS